MKAEISKQTKGENDKRAAHSAALFVCFVCRGILFSGMLSLKNSLENI